MVNLTFASWKEGHVAPTHLEVPVVAPKSVLKLEPVSDRLIGELIHPNKGGFLDGLRFSADGTRLIAGDYPGGVVMVWDVASGKQLMKIETGYAYRQSSQYFFVSSDWQSLFVSRGKRKYEWVKKDGKKMLRWEMDGDVRAWNLATGQVVRTYQSQPPRNVEFMSLSPDGTVFFTLEEIPGVYERQPKQVVSLWDVQTGQARPLPDRLFSTGPFSPDSRTFAAKVTEENGYTQALKLFDVASGREKWTVPIPEKTAKAYFTGFSPDGRLLAGEYRVFDQPQKWDHWQSRVKIWETAHGREVLSSVPARDSVFYNAQFSPDSRVLAVTNWKSETGKLLLFRPGDNQPPRVIILGQTPRGQRLLSIKPEFRGDGKWLALITQVVPEVRSGATDARDYPQPRIHLIDVAAGEIRETLVAPPAFARCASFSPDGTLLATGGLGRVLLWDVRKLPGSPGTAEKR